VQYVPCVREGVSGENTGGQRSSQANAAYYWASVLLQYCHIYSLMHPFLP